MPFGLLAVPDYWNPVRIAVVGGIGAEDLLFAAAVGGWSWLLASWPLGDRAIL